MIHVHKQFQPASRGQELDVLLQLRLNLIGLFSPLGYMAQHSAKLFFRMPTQAEIDSRFAADKLYEEYLRLLVQQLKTPDRPQQVGYMNEFLRTKQGQGQVYKMPKLERSR